MANDNQLSTASEMWGRVATAFGDRLQTANDLLTTSQTAKICGVTEPTVRNWSLAGKIPTYYTVGGHRRFRRLDVEAIASQQNRPTPDPKKVELALAAGRKSQTVRQSSQEAITDTVAAGKGDGTSEGTDAGND